MDQDMREGNEIAVVKRRDGSLVATVLGDLVPELDVAAGEDAAPGPPQCPRTTLLSGSMCFTDFISSAGSFPSPPTRRTTTSPAPETTSRPLASTAAAATSRLPLRRSSAAAANWALGLSVVWWLGHWRIISAVPFPGEYVFLILDPV